MKYNKLTVLEEFKRGDGAKMMKCRCDCGKVKVLWRSNVIRGKSKCCGCSHAENKPTNNPMKNHKPMKQKSKDAAKKGYLTGNLPKWMYS